MAGSRKPGPLGHSGAAEDLNDGTMIRALSPRPGSIGSASASTRGNQRPSSLTPNSPIAARRTTAATTIQVLRQGSRGPEVQKLQRQLNVRLAPSPNLAVDGIFGPVTLQIVKQYQRGVSIAVDGVVGKQTWYHLLKGDKATVLQTPITTLRPAVASPTAASSTAPQPPRAAPPPAPHESIWEWPLEKKLLAVLERVPSRLPGRARDEFRALLQLENLALSLAIIAGFCLLSGGTALVLGVVILGLDMTMSLASAVQTAALAATEDELNEAADELAHVVLAVGVAAFIKGVGKIAKGVKGGGKSSAAEAPPKPAPERAAPQPRSAPKEPRAPTAPEAPPKVVSPIEQRRADNARLRKGPQFQEDMKKVGVTKEQIALMEAKEVPLGFKSREQFQQFKQELDVALKKDGLGDADVGMKGTATTFYSENPGKQLGHHWDADPANPGDFDLNITSKKMVGEMDSAGIKPSEKYGVFKTRDVEAQNPELRRFAKKWSKELGRDVNVVGYPGPQARDATEFILRGE